MRIEVGWTVMFLLLMARSLPATAQETVPVPVGSTVLIEIGSRMRVLPAPGNGELSAPLIGTLSGSRSDTLILLVRGETTPMKVPLAQAREVALSRGWGTHAWRGALLGAVIVGIPAGILTYLDESSSETCTGGCVYHNPAVRPMTALLTVAGAVAGGLVGHYIGSLFSVERWERIPLAPT